MRFRLAYMAIATGLSAILVAFLFARTSSASYSVARMQPLRTYLLIAPRSLDSCSSADLSGSTCSNELPGDGQRSSSCLEAAFSSFNCGFPNSAHLEILQGESGNGWESGFLWIREHTARDAVALDRQP